MADKYVLRVTAGPEYDVDKHVQVHVNTPEPIKITSEHMDIELNVRVQGYKGLPPNSPSTSPYFDQEPHAYNQDQYSISFRFTPKKPTAQNGTANANGDGNSSEEDELVEIEGIPATDLQFGNDFDHPIRDSLPPGINAGLNILKWWIDPGLEGDVYADKPYLYGPALSSFNIIHIGPGSHSSEKGGLWFEEGAGDSEDREYRKKLGCPDDGKGRMKWALKRESKEGWVWEWGKTYGVDFFNPYVDFGELSIRLPGFHLPVVKYWDGKTGLRYVAFLFSFFFSFVASSALLRPLIYPSPLHRPYQAGKAQYLQIHSRACLHGFCIFHSSSSQRGPDDTQSKARLTAMRRQSPNAHTFLDTSSATD